MPAVDVVLTNDSAGTDDPLDKQMCSCFVYVMANRHGSTWFLERWQNLTLQGSGLNQPPMNQALDDALNPLVYGSTTFIHMILPPRLFPNGATNNAAKKTAWWAHANWRVGKKAKHDLMMELGLWDADDIVCEAGADTRSFDHR